MVGDTLLARSQSLLERGPGAAWPACLALRDVSFRWRLRSEAEGNRIRFLFFDWQATDREMLRAELIVRLRPGPFGEPEITPVTLESAELATPKAVIWRPSTEEFARWAPPGADPGAPRRTLFLRLGREEILGVCGMADPSDPLARVDPEDIRARWARGGSPVDVDADGPWPLEMMLSLVAALAGPAAAEPGETGRLAELDPNLAVWANARTAAEIAAQLPGWLERAPRKSFDDPRLKTMRCAWRVAEHRLRADLLVNADGELAPADAENTFVAPFRVELHPDGPSPRVAVPVELPDIVPSGELRAVLLKEFQGVDELESVVKAFNKLPGARVSLEDLRAWCDPSSGQAQVVRVRRREKSDHYLLVLSGSVGGQAVAALIDAEETVVDIDDGGWHVEIDDVSEGYMGPVRGAGLVPGTGATGLCELLATLLRWRALLP
jgi:hypothetical protein